MPIKHRIFWLATLLSLLSACASAVPLSPTPEPPDLNATVAAMAETIVAGTISALPTATLFPTNTPLPSPTQTPAITATITPTTQPTTASRPWACAPDGRSMAMMEFRNDSSQTVFAVLSSPTCYREFTIDVGYSVVQTVPIDVYSYYGYIGSDTGFGGTVWLSDTIHTWVLYISDDGAILENP
jgi:hypothetical protein